MAAKHGRTAGVYFNGVDLSGYLNEAEMSVDAETADVTTFAPTAAGWRDKISGLLGATFTAAGFYDPDMTSPRDSLAVAGGVLTYCPGGRATIGDLSRAMSVIGTSFAESSNLEDAVAIAWNAEVSGAIAFGYLLHPLAEDTNTTTGATRDDTAGAAAANGWTAHLHVTAVDGGSWVVKIEDSANGSTWADLTGATFAAKTAAGGERLVSATSTTAIRRFIRYVATRTGGAGGDGITFALALARSNA